MSFASIIRILVFSLILLVYHSILLSQNRIFTQRDVEFYNGSIKLSGTLMLPSGNGPFPAVIFIHGSGVETRENSLYSAVWFTSIGYAALIYDKRSSGKSDGNKSEIEYFNFENLANDVIAAVDLLKENSVIDTTKIGLHASSQGGWIAPLVACYTNSINFIIMRSVSVVSVSEDRIFERSERLKSEGFSRNEIAESKKMQLLEGKTDSNDFDLLFQKNKGRDWFKSVYGNKIDIKELNTYREWYRDVSMFDPVPYLNQLDCPILWIFGDKGIDKFGPIQKSVNNLHNLQKKGKDYLILQYEGQGHNIDEAKYERSLYEWLCQNIQYKEYEFTTHLNAFKKYQASLN